jgi:uncharacterized protein
MPLDPTQRVMEKITAGQQGGPPPPADINRNGRPTSIGMGGRLQLECPADIIGIRSLLDRSRRFLKQEISGSRSKLREIEAMSSFVGHCYRVFALASSIAVLQPHPAAAMDAAKHAGIEQLMKDMHALAIMDRLIDALVPQIIANLKRINPNIPQAAWDEFARFGVEEFKKALPELEEPMAVIYDLNFSGAEIKELDAFYRSPLGQKLITVFPKIAQQSFAMGQAWGQRVGKRVEEDIRAAARQKGYSL